MSVIAFPRKVRACKSQEEVCDQLMDVAARTLDFIAADIREVSGGDADFKEQLIFVLDQLSVISDDLKIASESVQSG